MTERRNGMTKLVSHTTARGLRGILLAGVATIVAVTSLAATGAAVAATAAKDITIALVLNDLTKPVSLPLRKGAEDAAKELGFKLITVGPQPSTAQAQIALLETMPTQGANGVVLLLLTALVPALAPALAFVPDAGQALRHPWTWVTYAFVHAGLLHLAFNMMVLYALGCRVEERMGSRAFILFYLYCAVGGALFSLMDVAMGLACSGAHGFDRQSVTLECKINYIRAVAEGEVRCVAKVLHAGRRSLVVEADIFQGDKLVAKGQGTFAQL